MRFILAASALLISCSATLASGGISCTGDDEKAKFEVGGGVTHGMGGPLFTFEGSIEVADKTVADDLRKISVTREHVAQYWLDGQDLRLVIYRERLEGDHGYIELTIRTQVSEEGVYGGQYELVAFDTKNDTSTEGKRIEIKGTTSCFVE